ncbi:MAG: hypothetical protein IKQ12_10920 [Prevotella sp.]|nr:hypothetical protein [Prevotella sp.]
MAVLEKTSRNITVRLTKARWTRLMELENAYNTARSIAKAKRQCENVPSMSVSDAMKHIDCL